MRAEWNLDAPSGDLTRDLADKKRVLLRRGVTCEEARQIGDPSDRRIRFICSTDGTKRDGNRVRNDGWDLTSFRKNPVMLWSHDYGSDSRPPAPPIGSWSEESVIDYMGGKALAMTATFASHREADVIYRLYLEGHLRAVSIGWTPVEYEPMVDEDGMQTGWDMVANELLECSAVPIPADPDALIVATQRGIIKPEDHERLVATFGEKTRTAYVLDARDPVIEDAKLPGEAPAEEAPEEEYQEAAVAQSRQGTSTVLDVVVDRITGDHTAMVEPLAKLKKAIGEMYYEGRGTTPEDFAERELLRLQALGASLMVSIDEARETVTTGDEMDANQFYADTPEQARVGKKVSKSRAEKLREVRSSLKAADKLLGEVLRDAGDEKAEAHEKEEKASHEPQGAAEHDVEAELLAGLAEVAQRREDSEASALEQRLSEISRKLGVDPDPAGTLAKLLVG